ncbi:MAG TPA: glycosyltransferase 87 family protein [Candidatus Limnocylindrales bacterium]|nr:glycosyltransferase 87 family protein [Candidatus Limnocylindrales bacterium]
MTLLGMVAAALLCWRLDAGSRAGAFGPLADALFVTPYWTAGTAVAHGLLPYRDFPLEYPPLSLPLFVLPAIAPFGGFDYDAYRIAFEIESAFGVMLLVPVVVATVATLGAGRWSTIAAVALVAASPLLLGPLTISRYDVWPALVAAGATLAALRGRHRLALALLAVAILVKVYPAFLVPVFLAYAWWTAGRREAIIAGAVGAAVAAVAFGPFVAAAGEPALEPFLRPFARPLQIESLGASVLAALHNWLGTDIGRLSYTFESFNLEGSLASLAATLQTDGLVVVLVAVWLLVAARPMGPPQLVLGGATVVALVVALGKVLSPQYVIWLVPAVAVVVPVLGAAPLVALGGILALTEVYYPEKYGLYLIRFDPGAALAILERNLGLVVLAVMLVAATWWSGPARPRRPDRPADRAREAP